MRFIFRLCCVLLISANTLVMAEIRVMTLNTEWLWSPFDNYVDGGFKWLKDMGKDDYIKELEFYAALIQSRNIDVVALSEIENESVAVDLVDKLGSNWRVYFKQGRDTATGQDVALISRLGYVQGSLSDYGFPSGKITNSSKAKRLSKIVGAQFYYPDTANTDTKGQPKIIGVLTAHFLSKRNENKHKALNRQKQAVALTKAIDTLRLTTYGIVVLGDFNDVVDSETIDILLRHQLQSFESCDNFKAVANNNVIKKWRGHIDHIFYQGFDCLTQYETDLQRYSDHNAIYGEFKLNFAK